ncbi:MAG: hypothetical protein K2K65_05750 [Duncaniella sp.]|nr:hypothetical protein [Duncaniella sp.]
MFQNKIFIPYSPGGLSSCILPGIRATARPYTQWLHYTSRPSDSQSVKCRTAVASPSPTPLSGDMNRKSS